MLTRPVSHWKVCGEKRVKTSLMIMCPETLTRGLRLSQRYTSKQLCSNKTQPAFSGKVVISELLDEESWSSAPNALRVVGLQYHMITFEGLKQPEWIGEMVRARWYRRGRKRRVQPQPKPQMSHGSPRPCGQVTLAKLFNLANAKFSHLQKKELIELIS